MNLTSLLKQLSKKELQEMYDEVKDGKEFSDGFRKSAIGRELNRRESLKRKKK